MYEAVVSYTINNTSGEFTKVRFSDIKCTCIDTTFKDYL